LSRQISHHRPARGVGAGRRQVAARLHHVAQHRAGLSRSACSRANRARPDMRSTLCAVARRVHSPPPREGESSPGSSLDYQWLSSARLHRRRPSEAGSEIRRLNATGSAGKGFRILSGAEVNIRQDGTLDVANEALAEGLAFRASYDPDVRVRVDLGLERSAAQNVADNAARYTDSGGVEVTMDDRQRARECPWNRGRLRPATPCRAHTSEAGC
jgi:hypothetical protein